jgi:glycosyltransferase involved in cell wall biosynthesis
MPETRSSVHLLFAGQFAFARSLIAHFQSHADYAVTTDPWSGDSSRPSIEPAAIHEFDLIHCEWGGEQAVYYSHQKRAHQRLIIRLHAQEIYGERMKRVNWSRVDRAVFVSPAFRDRFLRRFPEMTDRTVVLRNMVDTDRFDRPKKDGVSRTLGLLGLYERIKGPDLALRLFEELYQRDGDYRLFFKGHHAWQRDYVWQTDVKRQAAADFYQSVRASPAYEAIAFSRHDPRVPEWLTQVGIILSTSREESSHLAVAEAMASGCVPVIRGWAGAEWQYPQQFVFPYEDDQFIEAAAPFVQALQTPEVFRAMSRDAQMFARTHFDARVIVEQFASLYVSILRHP